VHGAPKTCVSEIRLSRELSRGNFFEPGAPKAAPVAPQELRKRLSESPLEAIPKEDAVKRAPDAKNAMLAESREMPEKRQNPKNARDSRTGWNDGIANGPRTPKTLQGPSRRGGGGGEHGPT